MDPEALRILKRVDRYLNALRALVFINVFLTLAIVAAGLFGYFYVKHQVPAANQKIDSQVQDIRDRIPSVASFNLR
jgi:hypothetical protein